MSILDKKQMTEEDIKLNFITPAIKVCFQKRNRKEGETGIRSRKQNKDFE